jgi:hypothetical protein
MGQMESFHPVIPTCVAKTTKGITQCNVRGR